MGSSGEQGRVATSGIAWAALAGLLFLTLPLIMKLSVTVYVDLGLIFFTTAALFSTGLSAPQRR